MTYEEERRTALKNHEEWTVEQEALDYAWVKLKHLTSVYNESLSVGRQDYLDYLRPDMFTETEALYSVYEAKYEGTPEVDVF